MDKAGAHPSLWIGAIKYAAYVYNRTANELLGWTPPYEKSTGDTQDISHMLVFNG